MKSATVFGVALDFFVFGGASGAIAGVGCDGGAVWLEGVSVGLREDLV